jgi:cytochrome c-type biogenesis protein CcsB
VTANSGLSTLSNDLFIAAVVTYALAMLGFAIDAAAGTRTQHATDTLHVDERVLVTAGGGSAPADVSETHAAPATPPSDKWSWTRRAGFIAVALTVLAWVMHGTSLATRGFADDALPWSNMYGFASAGAFAVAGSYLILLTRQRVRWLGLAVTFAVVVTMGLAGTVLYTAAGPLQAPLRSYWLSIHVTAAIISSGVLTVGSSAAALYLVRSRYDARVAAGSRPGLSRIGRMLPTSDVLDRTAYRVLAFAFPIWTFAIIAGAIWAESAWGRYWGWDPKETWAFITWVIYACYLHARSTAGWRGTRSAWIALVGFCAFLFNFFGINIFIVGLHSYAGV